MKKEIDGLSLIRYSFLISLLLVCVDINGQSVVLSPSTGPQGQTLTVTFTGVSGASFSQFTETCSSHVYNVNYGNIYFQQFSGTTIYPTTIYPCYGACNSFNATFSIPSGAPVSSYNVVLNASGTCPITVPGGFVVTSGPSVNVNPASASPGQVLAVTFTGVRGATFSQFSGTCPQNIGSSNFVYNVSTTSVYFQQFSTTTIFPTSINPFNPGDQTFTANFSIPANASISNYDVVVGNGSGCTITNPSAFSVVQSPVAPPPPVTPPPVIPSPTITGFTPVAGAVGTVVTINGANFDLNPAKNGVKFHGTTAIVTASTTTSITTSVPVGATTGPITVAVNGQTANSVSDFTVQSPTTGDLHLYSMNSDIKLYPNPAREEIIIGLEHLDIGAWVEVAVFDMSGRQLDCKVILGGGSVVMDIRHYAPANYIVKAVQNQKAYYKQFVKE